MRNGHETATQLGILKLGVGINHILLNEESSELFPKYKDIMVEIPVDTSIKPVTQPYRRIPISLEQKISKKIDELKSNIIEEVHGPSPWVSPKVKILMDNGEVRCNARDATRLRCSFNRNTDKM